MPGQLNTVSVTIAPSQEEISVSEKSVTMGGSVGLRMYLLLMRSSGRPFALATST